MKDEYIMKVLPDERRTNGKEISYQLEPEQTEFFIERVRNNER